MTGSQESPKLETIERWHSPRSLGSAGCGPCGTTVGRCDVQHLIAMLREEQRSFEAFRQEAWQLCNGEKIRADNAEENRDRYKRGRKRWRDLAQERRELLAESEREFTRVAEERDRARRQLAGVLAVRDRYPGSTLAKVIDDAMAGAYAEPAEMLARGGPVKPRGDVILGEEAEKIRDRYDS